MKLQVKTTVLKDLINKVTKISTNNKMIPLTGLLSISLNNGILKATASDAVNFFSISVPDITGDDFNVVVKVDSFHKIVTKTTSENITLELTDKILNFTGNGTYKIELPLNEEGLPIKYPTINVLGDVENSGTITMATIKSIIMSNKSALAVTSEAPYLMNYACTPDNIVSADSYNICINTAKTFGTTVLIAPVVFDLLNLFDAEEVNYKFDGKAFEFKTDKMFLYAKTANGIEDYPVDAIMGYAETTLPSKCSISKTAILNTLDRLSLFIGDFDINGVYLNFTKDGIKVTSKNDLGSELIPYSGSDNFNEYICLASVDALKKQISARSGETVNIEYGEENVLKFVDNNIIHIVALLGDDEEA